MKVLRWLFPVGAILTIVGVFLCGLLEYVSSKSRATWFYPILEPAFLLALLIGSPVAVVGSFVERRRLPLPQARTTGAACMAVSAISLLLLYTMGNVHDWTMTLICPAFVGFVTGLVLLSKLKDSATESS